MHVPVAPGGYDVAMRRLITLLAAGLALAGCQFLPTADELSAAERLVSHRQQVGAGPLEPNAELQLKARAWAQELVDRSGGGCGALAHSNLAVGAPAGWDGLGENVGCSIGPNVATQLGPIHDGFANSPGHRANLDNPAWTHAAIGVAAAPASCCPGAVVVYEVQVFMTWWP